jgi:hypothetical protein
MMIVFRITRVRKMSNLLFIRRSLALRHAAVMAMREARTMPVGLERSAARRRARGLKELARTEAWLEGQSPLADQASRQGARRREPAAHSAGARGI